MRERRISIGDDGGPAPRPRGVMIGEASHHHHNEAVVLSNPRVREFKEKLTADFERMKKVALGREALVVMAEKLQYELTCDREHRYPHSNPLEYIMRAVIGALKDVRPAGREQRSWRGYVLTNLQTGVRGLRSAFGWPE
jgi:hypothetical protein